MKNIFICFFLIIANFISYTNPSCMCNGFLGIDEADFVFIGRVNQVKYGKSNTIIEFEVIKQYKGKKLKKDTFKVKNGNSSCDYIFEENKFYAVYSEEEKNGFSVHDCSHTTEVKADSIESYKPKKTTETKFW